MQRLRGIILKNWSKCATTHRPDLPRHTHMHYVFGLQEEEHFCFSLTLNRQKEFFTCEILIAHM